MSKENAKQFLKLMQEDTELSIRLEQAMKKLSNEELNKENIEKVFNEEVVLIAKERGLEFTLEELQNPYDGRLTDDELDKAVGGITDENGNWLTTVGFSCGKWKEDSDEWLGVRGTCGSCKYWGRGRGPQFPVYMGRLYVCNVNRD